MTSKKNVPEVEADVPITSTSCDQPPEPASALLAPPIAPGPSPLSDSLHLELSDSSFSSSPSTPPTLNSSKQLPASGKL